MQVIFRRGHAGGCRFEPSTTERSELPFFNENSHSSVMQERKYKRTDYKKTIIVTQVNRKMKEMRRDKSLLRKTRRLFRAVDFFSLESSFLTR